MIHATVIGNIGKDAEVSTKDGRTYTRFSVGAKNPKEENTTWVNVTLNGDKMAQYIQKGQQIAVTGKVTAKVWKEKVDMNMWAETVELLGSRAKKEDAAPAKEAEADTDFP